MTDIAGLADDLFLRLSSAEQRAPVSDGDPEFDLATADAVAARIRDLRLGSGDAPVGWKIGFTNRTIWETYGVHAPIWGPMWASTCRQQVDDAPCPLDGLAEPRLEPEISFRLASSPEPGTSAADLLAHIDGVAFGFEIVHSLYPGWRFEAADTMAAFALHGRHRHLPFIPIAAEDRGRWAEMLETFTIRLFKGHDLKDEGRAANVLDGPLHALAAFIDALAGSALGPRVAAGSIVTTGTLTDAWPVAPGETWRAELQGIALDGMTLSFR